MPSIIGKIISFEGTFNTKGVDGSIRQALLGDNIYEGEVLIGDKNNTPLNNIEISMADGSTIIIRGQEKQLFDVSLTAQEFSKEETITQKDSIEAMLEASGDLEEIQELETAAGEEAVTESLGTAEATFAELNNASVNVSADLRDRIFLEEHTENIEDFTREDIRRALGDTLVTADPSVTAVNDAPTITVTSVNDFTEDSGNVVGDTVATYTT
ncbi:MAG: cell shape-determining protein MreD, partial [Sulfurimonas sp.]